MPVMHRLHPLSWIATALVVSCLAACQPKPAGGGGLGSPGIISCGTQAVAAAAPQALGPVNACLAGGGDIQACLLGLIQPALNITLATIGCLTRHEGAAASAASQANPGDGLDRQKAQRAREFLEKMDQRGYRFTD